MHACGAVSFTVGKYLLILTSPVQWACIMDRCGYSGRIAVIDTCGSLRIVCDGQKISYRLQFYHFPVEIKKLEERTAVSQCCQARSS